MIISTNLVACAIKNEVSLRIVKLFDKLDSKVEKPNKRKNK